MRPAASSLSMFVLGASLGAAGTGAAPEAPLVRHEASRMSMGCAYAIVAYGRDAAALPGWWRWPKKLVITAPAATSAESSRATRRSSPG